MHSAGLKKLWVEFSVFINYSGSELKKWADKTNFGLVINSKNCDLLSRVGWTVLGQCPKRSEEEMLAGCQGRGSCKLRENCKQLPLGSFCSQVLLKGSRRYFIFEVSSFTVILKHTCTHNTVEVVMKDLGIHNCVAGIRE